MKETLLAAVLVGLCGVTVWAQKAGDEVFVTSKEEELRTGKDVTGKVSRGQTVAVQSVNGDWLWISQNDQQGWIHREKVIPADQALAYLSEQLKANRDPEDYAIRGRLWFRKGKPHLALADLNEALRIDPTVAETWCNRGSTWFAIGEYDKSIADYDEAIDLDPTAVCHFINRGRAWRSLGQLDKALQDCNRAIQLDPDIADSYVDRGAVLQDKGEYQKAIASLTQGIELGVKSGTAHFNRSLGYYSLGKRDEAIKDLDEAIRRNPHNSRYFNQRGLTWHDEKNYEKAMSDFDEAIRLDPSDSFPIGNRGMVWSALGDQDKAIADYTAAIRINPRVVNFYSNRGNSWYRKNELDLAIADYSHAIHVDPNYAEAFLNRGSALEEKGQLQRAIADYSSAIRLKPDFAFAYHGRADVRRKQKEYARAVDDYSRSLELNSKNLAAANSLAWLLATCSDPQIRDGKRAVDVATHMCELSKWKEWGPLDTLAAAYAEAGEFEDAVRWQQKALELAPEQFHDEVVSRLALFRAKQPYRQPSGDASPEIATTGNGGAETEEEPDDELDSVPPSRDLAEVTSEFSGGDTSGTRAYGPLQATVSALSRSIRASLPTRSRNGRAEDALTDEEPDSLEPMIPESREERPEEADDGTEKLDDAEEAQVVANLTPEQFPLPNDASDVERKESIQWIVFRSQLKPSQVSKFYHDQFAESGFKGDPAESFVDDTLGVGSISLSRGEEHLHIVVQDGAPKSVTRVIIEGNAIAWPDEDAGLPKLSAEEADATAVIHSDIEFGQRINDAQEITTSAKVTHDGETYTLSHCIGYQLPGFDEPQTVVVFTNRQLPAAKFRKEVIENGGSLFDVVDPFGLNYLRMKISESSVAVSSQVGGGFSGFGISSGTRNLRVRGGKAQGRIQFTYDEFDPPFGVTAEFDIELLKP